MTIIKLDHESQKAVVELSRSEVEMISNLMCRAKVVKETRSHFYLLYELLRHGVLDTCALQIAHQILEEALNKEGEA